MNRQKLKKKKTPGTIIVPPFNVILNYCQISCIWVQKSFSRDLQVFQLLNSNNYMSFRGFIISETKWLSVFFTTLLCFSFGFNCSKITRSNFFSDKNNWGYWWEGDTGLYPKNWGKKIPWARLITLSKICKVREII